MDQTDHPPGTSIRPSRLRREMRVSVTELIVSRQNFLNYPAASRRVIRSDSNGVVVYEAASEHLCDKQTRMDKTDEEEGRREGGRKLREQVKSRPSRVDGVREFFELKFRVGHQRLIAMIFDELSRRREPSRNSIGLLKVVVLLTYVAYFAVGKKRENQSGRFIG